MTIRPLLLATVLATSLVGCASAPVNYYTLVPAGGTGAPTTPRTFAFDLQPVNLPAQVDQPQLVVRQNGAGIALVESERWIAPLGDEIQAALATELVARHGGENLGGLPQADRPLVKVKVELRRFDSAPGRSALIDAAWSLRRQPGNGTALACSSRIEEPVGAGYEALVLGHQRALARLADAIAGPAQTLAAGQTATCP